MKNKGLKILSASLIAFSSLGVVSCGDNSNVIIKEDANCNIRIICSSTDGKLYKEYNVQALKNVAWAKMIPEIDGYRFEGFYSDVRHSVLLTEDIIPTSNLTLYANFVKSNENSDVSSGEESEPITTPSQDNANTPAIGEGENVSDKENNKGNSSGTSTSGSSSDSTGEGTNVSNGVGNNGTSSGSNTSSGTGSWDTPSTNPWITDENNKIDTKNLKDIKFATNSSLQVVSGNARILKKGIISLDTDYEDFLDGYLYLEIPYEDGTYHGNVNFKYNTTLESYYDFNEQSTEINMNFEASEVNTILRNDSNNGLKAVNVTIYSILVYNDYDISYDTTIYIDDMSSIVEIDKSYTGSVRKNYESSEANSTYDYNASFNFGFEGTTTIKCNGNEAVKSETSYIKYDFIISYETNGNNTYTLTFSQYDKDLEG